MSSSRQQSTGQDWFTFVSSAAFGFDFFISYRRGESRAYAHALYEHLTRKGYRCFIDDHEAPTGTTLDEFRRQATRSRTFLLVGSTGILESTYCAEELHAYTNAHGGWPARYWSRVIPIDIGGALRPFEGADARSRHDGSRWLPLCGLVFEPESESAWRAGRPSASVLDRVERSFLLVRASRMLLVGSLATAMITALLIVSVATRLSMLQGNISTLAQQRAELVSQGKELGTQVTELNEQKLKLAAETTSLNAQNTELQTQKANLAGQRDVLTAANSSLQRQSTALRGNLETLTEDVRLVRRELKDAEFAASEAGIIANRQRLARAFKLARTEPTADEALRLTAEGLTTEPPESPLARSAIAASLLAATRSCHFADAVRASGLAADGDALAVVTDGIARLFNIRTCEKLASTDNTQGYVIAVGATRAGLRILSSTGDRLAVSPVRGPTEATLTDAFNTIDASFAPQADSVVLLGEFGGLSVWDYARGISKNLPGGRNPFQSFAHSNDSLHVLASTVRGEVLQWSARDGWVHPRAWPVTGVLGSPQIHDIRFVLNAGVVYILDPEGKRAASLGTGCGWITSAALQPIGGHIVTGSEDGRICVWDGKLHRLLTQLGQVFGEVKAVAFSSDGRLVAVGGADQRVTLWDMLSGRILEVLEGHGSPVDRLLFSASDDRLVSVSSDTIFSWDVRRGRQLASLTVGGDVVMARFWHEESRIVAMVSGTGAVIWRPGFPDPVTRALGVGREIWRASLSPSGASLLTTGGGYAGVVDLEHGAVVEPLGRDVREAIFLGGDDRVVTTDSTDTVRIWDLRSQEVVAGLDRVPTIVAPLAATPLADRIFVGVRDASSLFWAPGATSASPVPGVREEPRCATFSPDGRRLVVGSMDGSVLLWTIGTDAVGPPRWLLPAHTDGVTACEFSVDGTRLVTASYDRTARVWDVATGELLSVLTGHKDTVWSAEFSFDGSRVVTGSYDQSARVWDVWSGTEMTALVGHTGRVLAASFSEDGTQVVTGSQDKTVRIWGVPSPLPATDDARVDAVKVQLLSRSK